MKYIKFNKSILNEDFIKSYDDSDDSDFDEISRIGSIVSDKHLNDKTPLLISLFNFCNGHHFAMSGRSAYKSIFTMLKDGDHYKSEIEDIMNKTYTRHYICWSDDEQALSKNDFDNLVEFYKNNYDIAKFILFCKNSILRGLSSPSAILWMFKGSDLEIGMQSVYNQYDCTIYDNIMSGFKSKSRTSSDYNVSNLSSYYLDILFEPVPQLSSLSFYNDAMNEKEYPEGFPISKASGGVYNLNFVFYNLIGVQDIRNYAQDLTSIGENGSIKKSTLVTPKKKFDSVVKEFKANSKLKTEFKKIENAINNQFSKNVFDGDKVAVHIYVYSGTNTTLRYAQTDQEFIKNQMIKWDGRSYFVEQIF